MRRLPLALALFACGGALAVPLLAATGPIAEAIVSTAPAPAAPDPGLEVRLREQLRAERREHRHQVVVLVDRLQTVRARLTYVSPRQGAWECIHAKEGSWSANTGNGYHGGLQMDWPFMRTYGADQLRRYGGPAELWSPADQVRVADRAWAVRGFGPWPNTARACGLL